MISQRQCGGSVKKVLDIDVPSRAKRDQPHHADDHERTGADAVPAAVADVGLDDDGVELRADDRAGGADLETAGPHAVLADVGHHEPTALAALSVELLDELHVAPVDTVEPPRVVVGIARKLAAPAVRRGQLIPFLAGDLTRLAPDAHRRVRVKPHRLGHQTFSTLQTKALPSWIETLGSATSEVSSLTMSPVTSPS